MKKGSSAATRKTKKFSTARRTGGEEGREERELLQTDARSWARRGSRRIKKIHHDGGTRGGYQVLERKLYKRTVENWYGVQKCAKGRASSEAMLQPGWKGRGRMNP